MADDDIKFVKENSLASKPITESDLDKPSIVIGFMKNEKGSGGKQTKGGIREIRKRGDVYDIYHGDELRPSSRDVPKEEILRLYSQEATSGYMYKTTSRQDPKLAKWINIDDEDIYINRLTDKDPLSPLKFIGESKKPVAEIDYNAKIRDGSITVREAFEAVLAKPKLSSSNKGDISSLLNKLPDEGIDLNARYFDVYETKEFMEALDYTTNTTGVHRYKEFGAFETQLEGLVRFSKRNKSYDRISDSSKAKGLASSIGLKGTQLRGKDPMRGLVPSKSFDRIFHQALSEPESSEVDTKRGRDRVKVIDQQAADYLIYEKYTGQRLESNIGADGLKISDFNFYTDKNNNTVVEVAEKVSGNKTRPAVIYTGEFAEFLRNKVESTKATLPPDADPSKVNLFQTTVRATDKLWNDRVRPQLEKEFRKQLPAGKGGSHSVVRKILARQLVQEFEMPRDAVKSWMGHAGAGVNASGDILDESYTGAVPDKRVGELTNVLIRSDARNTPNVNNINSLFVQRGAGFSQEVLFDIPETIELGESATLTESKATTRSGEQLSPGEREELSAQASRRAVKLEIGTEKYRQQLGEIRSRAAQSAPQATKPTVESPTPKNFDDLSPDTKGFLERNGIDFDSLVKNFGKKTTKVLVGALGVETARQIVTEPAAVAAEVGLEAGARALGLAAAPAAAVPMMLAPSELASGELRPEDRPPQDPAGPYAGQDFIPAPEVEETDDDMMARVATQDSGMIPEPSRVPEAAPAQDQGFLSR